MIVIVDDPIQKIRDPISAYQSKFKVAEAKAAGYSDEKIAAYLSRRAIVYFAKKAIVPPLSLLAAGFGASWVISGLRRSRSN